MNSKTTSKTTTTLLTRKRIFILAALAVFSLSATLYALTQAPAPTAASTPQAATPLRVEPGSVAGPGRVEPVSEEIRLSATIGGRLTNVPVEEGDHIQRGQVLAEIENADYRARVASAAATLAQREAELRRIINGARTMERKEAWAEVQAAQAEMENARIEMERRKRGYEQDVFSREEYDRAARAYGVAKGRYEAAVERHKFVDAEPREEDRARAEAEVALARARLDEAQAILDKTTIRSPIAGVVLRKHRKAGELVSEQFDTPLLTIADSSVLRVRVDVDENDVAKVQVGQRAWVVAEAFPGQRFEGRIVRIGRLLGRKNIRTEEPTERVDTKVLETLIELDGHPPLPIGLRVDAFIRVN